MVTTVNSGKETGAGKGMAASGKDGRDDLVDALAVTFLITVIVGGLCLWLAGMPG